VILVDTNVPMYLIGAEHPHKTASQRMLERAATSRERLVTDAEVFQEILHRYGAIGRRDAIQPAFDVLNALVDEVFPVTAGAVERANDLLFGYGRLSAREALHVATMQAHGVTRIMSFDAAFDAVPGLTRLST
jgi:predicted nucleic acid-binding protein